jgi:hypothetical protein
MASDRRSGARPSAADVLAALPLAAASLRLRPPGERGCSHPCHGAPGGPADGIAVRVVDYRQAVAPLDADLARAEAAYLAQFCPDCGQSATGIAVRAIDLPAGQSLGFGHRLTVHPPHDTDTTRSTR